MGLYANWSSINHQPSTEDVNLWPKTVGGAIMAACNPRNLDPNNFANMQDIVHQFSVNANLRWTWNPQRTGRSVACGKGLLDRLANNEHQGECGWLAYALYVLLTTPAPYGFGQKIAEDKVHIYSGRIDRHGSGIADEKNQSNEVGFISAHRQLYHNRGPNTYNLTSTALDLYKWGDHVVVEWRNRFWDPSYDAYYDEIGDMAQYNLVTEDSQIVGNELEITYQGHPRGSLNDVWFRQLSTLERANFTAGSMLIGPYVTKPVRTQTTSTIRMMPPEERRRDCCCLFPWWPF